MPTGQRVLQLCTLVNSGDEADLPAFCDDGKFDCNYLTPVYADGSGDDLKNDKSSILITAQDWVTAITFVLQKNIAGTWTDQATITDNTYGEFYAMGAFEDKPLYSGMVFFWALILPAFGAGEYRVQTTQVTPLGDQVSFSRQYCLKEWNCHIDNQVRLEWTANKGYGDIDNDKEIIDFDDINWYFQIRIASSFFGYPKSEYEKEDIQFSNGKIEDVKNVQTETYILKLGLIPAWLHNTIKTLALQSNTLNITDFSLNNPQEFIRKEVIMASSYEPRWQQANLCAPVTIELTPTFNRLERFNCL